MKPGRNDACPCGSGKKYKKCCEITPSEKGTSGNGKPQLARMPGGDEIRTLERLYGQERFQEAEMLSRLMIQACPGYYYGWMVLACTLLRLGRVATALGAALKAAELAPGEYQTHGNLGSIYSALKRPAEAEAAFRRALALNPNAGPLHNNLGILLADAGRLTEAIESYQRAFKLIPDYPEAFNNMGYALKSMGRLAEAENAFRRAFALKPSFSGAHSNLLFVRSNNVTVDAATLFAEHCEFGRLHDLPPGTAPDFSNSREPERPLRVGLVSADFRDHALASFFEPILALLANDPGLSLYAYVNAEKEDAVTARFQGYLPRWYNARGVPDTVLVERIRADCIDILIDMSGHTGGNRLPVFALRAAPVQASWMGYPGTTGLRAMDYYIGDRHFLPPGMFDAHFSEKIVRLSANAPFRPHPAAVEPNPLPALRNGYLTLGSFNRLDKINHEVVELWAKVLRAVPDARMLLGGMPRVGFDKLLEWFANEGIDGARLHLHERTGMSQYMGLHHKVDMCLDTFPYTGGTTTCHALWMGVPTLTLAGNTPASRQGAAILGQVGLGRFSATSQSDFVQMGVYWASHFDELAELRAGLRERFAASAMAQPEIITNDFRRALRRMWQCWCAGKAPESIDATCEMVEAAVAEAMA